MQDLSAAYENGAHIPGAERFPARWARLAAAFRAAHDVSELPGFHAGTRRAVDMARPEGGARGTLIFVHGGYWRAFSRRDWTHLAAGAMQRGWATALPGYDLCPGVRISDITQQMAAAVTAVAEATHGPLVLAGHSAGGHLVARMLAPGMLPGAVLSRVRRVAPISMLSDLRPLLHTAMNGDLRLDAEEAVAESPILQPRPAVEVRLWVGGEERPAFLAQSQGLARAWDVPLEVAAGRHHFNVVDLLEDPQSAMMRDICDV